jgi:hypothetical protein
VSDVWWRAFVVREQTLQVEFEAPADTDEGTLRLLAMEASDDGWFEAETEDLFVAVKPSIIEEEGS